MWYRRAQVILLALIATLSLIPGFPPVRAEAYTLTVSPSRTQETNSPGVTLSLGVTGASVPLAYTFEWIVFDPSGNTKNAIKSAAAGQSSFELSVVYPQDFGGSAAIAYVGTYNVNVAQTTPVFDPQVAVGTFDARLTDETSYQRTLPVSVKATSYSPNENVTIDISRGGIPAPGSRSVLIDANGNLAYTWQTGPSTLTGTYTVTLIGTITTPKSPADSQTFGVVTAIMNVAVSVPNATLAPGDVLALSAIVTYPDGTILSQGSVTAVLSAAARPLGNQASLLYDPNQGKWTGGYTVGGSDPAGLWVVQVSASDPYGNSGQSSVSALENILPTPTPEQNPLTSFWFLTVLGVVGASALLGLLVFKRKRIVRHQLMVDLQAVDREADRVKNQDFFKSIQDQLNRKRSDPKETGNG